ncbi:unnamed protein product [Paramecium sonneborni]|uniref:Uncharacterized protein n=1 Tax=Paramecium sonneborni TaxID=65129 RepID=A0A8S1RL49_9CILI|nr:unnamed protein product [Paramecium sonneborni]
MNKMLTLDPLKRMKFHEVHQALKYPFISKNHLNQTKVVNKQIEKLVKNQRNYKQFIQEKIQYKNKFKGVQEKEKKMSCQVIYDLLLGQLGVESYEITQFVIQYLIHKQKVYMYPVITIKPFLTHQTSQIGSVNNYTFYNLSSVQ